jgi:hypothetical protein
LEEVNVRAGCKVLMDADFYFTDCWQSTRAFRPAARVSSTNCMFNIIVTLSNHIKAYF